MSQNKQLWCILLIVFFGFLGISIPYLVFPSLFLKTSYSIVPADWSAASRSIFLGITLAAYPFGQFLGAPTLGALSDQLGRKKLMSQSLLITAFSNLVSGYAIIWQNIGLLIISRFLAGVMEGNIAIARAMAIDLKEISKHKAFGRINASASIAFLMGPLIGGILSDKTLSSYFAAHTPFFVVFPLFIILSVLAHFVLRDNRATLKRSARSFFERLNLIKRLKVLFAHSYLKNILLVSTVFTLAVDIFYEFGPIYLTLKWNYTPSQLVSYNALLCCGLAIGNGWLADFIAHKFNSRSALLFSIPCFSLNILILTLTNSPLLALFTFLLVGLCIGITVTTLTVKISNSAVDDMQGEVMGVQVSLRVFADAIICLLGGFLLLISPKIILFLAAIISLYALVHYYNKSYK